MHQIHPDARTTTAVRAEIKGVIALLERRIAKAEARMMALVEAVTDLAAIERQLRTAPGIGPIVPATLIAGLPELGQLDRRGIAALVGLARVVRQRTAIRDPVHQCHARIRNRLPISGRNLTTVADKPAAVQGDLSYGTHCGKRRSGRVTETASG